VETHVLLDDSDDMIPFRRWLSKQKGVPWRRF
jgi:hypothetical protein